jgi:hypothetical protein
VRRSLKDGLAEDQPKDEQDLNKFHGLYRLLKTNEKRATQRKLEEWLVTSVPTEIAHKRPWDSWMWIKGMKHLAKALESKGAPDDSSGIYSKVAPDDSSGTPVKKFEIKEGETVVLTATTARPSQASASG